jgi:3-hydroxymyristoyl/3-hydroxydecanoyl-(acyl carrier protein) dehydratase
MIGFDSMGEEKIIERKENSISLEFSIPDSSPYFDGHFPGFFILPAVAQMELVMRFASRYLETGVGLSEIRRVKFTKLIQPFDPLLLKLTRNETAVSFNMSSPDGKIVYSSGTVIPERK